MSKHSTTPRTLSRRLAALLAALALLAAMALPVYAEALDGATGTAQAEKEDTISDSTVTTENDSTTPEGEEETEDSTANADGNNASENEDTKDNASSSTTGDSNTTADDAANDTPQTLPADNIGTTAGKTTMDDTLDTTDGDAKQNIVTRSADDAETADDASIQPVDEATSNGIMYPIMVYFAVPENFNDSWSVKFNAKKGDDNNSWVKIKPMTLKSPEYQGRRVFGVELTESECEKGAFGEIQFQYYEANNWQAEYKITTSTSVETIANKLFDAKDRKWVEGYKPFDPTDHTAFKEKTMAFKNAAATDLTNVVAHFYEKTNGTLAEVEKHDLEPVSVGATVQFQIPTAACSYVQFTADNKEISSLYNFYGQEVGTGEESFLFDETNCFCFVYTEKASNWTRGGDGRTIFYDATFSKPSLDTANAIPSIVGGDVYYYLTGPDKTAQFGKMTRQSDDRYYIDGVADGYDHIIFAARSTGDNGIKPDNLAKSGESTANLEIPWANEYAFPCFYADTGDDSTYKSDTNNQRGGYWAEVNTLRDAETNKKTGKAVVDVQQADFKADSSTKYIDTTLYDYYTDWELNGNNRDTYDHNFSEDGNAQNAFPAHRNWVPFRQFDQAVSDYYLSAGAFESNNSVLYPIYTGHFQPQEFNFKPFAELSGALNLFGFTNGRAFMAANNSALCANTDDNRTKYYDYTFQGIVADQEVNGQPIMRGTENGTNKLVEPHFNEDFLKGNNSKKAKLGDVYENVSFPFTQADVFGENVKYWAFDAADTTLYLKQDSSDSNSYFLQKSNDRTASENRESNTTVKKEKDKDNHEQPTYGFFPFNETIPNGAQASNYNYGFGAKLQFNFTLTENGKVKSDKGEDVPIKFFFSGDDDVWVFIDGQLVLDVGGAHGKASGLLEFGENGDKNTVTPYVSKVKVGGTATLNSGNLDNSNDWDNRVKKTIIYQGSNNKNEKIDFYYAGDTGDTIEYDKGTTHTLTMYYMERGMWESNMAIAFNFPDHNELQVEKKVDLSNVPDKEFAACFTNQKLFNFTILNQATHYGPKAVEEGSVQQVPPKKLSSNDYNTLGRMGDLQNDDKNYCKLDGDPDTKNTGNNTGQVIHWYAEYDDTHSDYRNARMGVITLKESVDITGMDYLSFYIYASGIKGEGTLSLSNMYLQLVDSSGKVLGCNDKESLSGTTYNQVDPKNNEWIKIKLDLSRLTRDSHFDMARLKEIRIGDNFQRHIYFKDFTFTANPTIKKITGFTTEQKDIPDYGSAADGKLKPAESAQFSSSIDGETHAVDENGQFTLQDKEVVTFSDQFRRGSYLSVTEDADPALFDTTWTIYENGVPVKKMVGGNTVENANPTPKVDGVSSYTPSDGRTEYAGTAQEQNGNRYKVAQKPNAETIVFRSYSLPDSGENGSLAKLKLQFVNKVKTGSLTIKKQAAAYEDDEIGKGTYTFTVTFTDVGGLGLESKPIKQTVTINGIDEETITGIPVGTRFHIEETTASNNANVSKVEVTGGGKDCKVVNGKEAIGSIVEYKQDKPSTVAVATFTNTTRTLINIDLTKQWVDAEGAVLPDKNLPDIVYVQLQRKTIDATEWTPVKYPEGETKDYVAVNRGQSGWTHSFTNLDANDYTSKADTKPVYQYRVVEGVLENGEFVAKNPETDAFLLSDKYAYTYTGNEMQTTTTDGKTSNTITLINKRLDPKFALDITKKDAENVDTLLKNVEFKLEKLDENNNVVKDSAKYGITNADGKLMIKGEDGNPTNDSAFTGLEAGKYRLTETKAAENYNLLSAPIEVEFTKTGQCLLNGVKVNVSTADQHTDFTKNADGSYTLALTVLNRKTPALPHTGADAPSLWLLIGLPLAVAGLLILVFRYNKKGGRTR